MIERREIFEHEFIFLNLFYFHVKILLRRGFYIFAASYDRNTLKDLKPNIKIQPLSFT